MPEPLRPDSPVTALPKVNRTEAAALGRLGLGTVRDLLLNLPYEWDSYGEPGTVAQAMLREQATVVGRITSVNARRIPRRGRLVEHTLTDADGGRLRLTWFNAHWMEHRLQPGMRVAVAGEVRHSRFGVGMVNPQHEILGASEAPRAIGGLTPRYHLRSGLKQKRMAELAEAALAAADQLEDPLPAEVRERQRLLPLVQAVRQGHRPAVLDDFREAARRLSFEELFELQVAFLVAREQEALEPATPVPYVQEVIDRFKAGLGFELTRAQRRSLWEIYQDLGRDRPMNRLLNGDVGSGKTAVAAAAVAMAHAARLQSVVMAPTEILARQHLEKFRTYLEGTFPDLRVEMLVSGLSAAERRRVKTAAASGHCALLVGTHALIEEDVQLAALGLAVVDEQHRFGTRQRELLRAKSEGSKPHFLAMTATPIPRSLALAVYGELALSTIDELPPGRTPVLTEVVAPERRQAAYELVRREVAAGRQAFVICPLVEESEKLEVKAATAEFERLQKDVFPELRLALVHGRLKEKDAVMQAFRDRQSDVLVATAVIEVGVDVPNATVMLIEGAERFGLAQLHQFRGRVGRGAAQSHCLLLSDDPGAEALRRLELLAATHDGFRLAEADMRMRGAGELLGSRQHGLSDAAMAALEKPELLNEARQEAEATLAADPGLARHPLLREAARRRLERTSIS